MDWQHLIMNGENLAEYAALLAAEGLLGPPARELRLGHVRRRQHGRRDGVHGDARAGASSSGARATARTASGSGSTSTRTPRTRSRPSGAASSSGGSSTRSPARIDDAALREAQAEKDAVRAYELVYAHSGARLRARAGAAARGRGRGGDAPGPVSVYVADDHGELVAAATMDGAAPGHAPERAAEGVHRCSERRDARPASWRQASAETTRPSWRASTRSSGSSRAASRRSRTERRVGAVGVSGLPGEEDERLALRGDRAAPASRADDDPRRARRRNDRRQGDRGLAGGRRARAPRRTTRSRRRGRAGPSRIPRTGGARRERALGRARRRGRAGDRALGPDARARGARRGGSRAAPGDPLERPAHRRGVRRDRGASRARRLVALTGNRALTGFTAPKLSGCAGTSPRSTSGSPTCCCRRTTSGSG